MTFVHDKDGRFKCTQCNEYVSNENREESRTQNICEECEYMNETKRMLSKVVIKDGKLWNPYLEKWVVCNK